MAEVKYFDDLENRVTGTRSSLVVNFLYQQELNKVTVRAWTMIRMYGENMALHKQSPRVLRGTITSQD